MNSRKGGKTASIIAGLLILVLIGGPMLGAPRSASAATGDLVHETHFSQNCPTGIGVGVAFDGTDLWYSCMSGTDLYRADPQTGNVVASYNIANGLGAISYDKSRNAIWAGWSDASGTVRLIQLDASMVPTSNSIVFTASNAINYELDDGLTYDGTDDSLYISGDVASTIYHYKSDGTELGHFSPISEACGNSGLGIGGTLLLEGFDGCNKIDVVNKASPSALITSFSTAVTSDPNFRDEGLACDGNTFAGKNVMWSQEAYDNNFSNDGSQRRALAFEIPLGSCGVGGQFSYSNVLTQDGNVISPGGTVKNNDQLADTGYTNNPAVTQITFNWTKPDGTTVTHVVATSEHEGVFSASDSVTPNQPGQWTVTKKFGSADVVVDSIFVPFFVLPESPVGVAALMLSSLAAFGAFIAWKKNS